MIVRELLVRLGVTVDRNATRVPDQVIQPIIDRSNQAAQAFRNIFLGFVGFSTIKTISQIADSMQSLQFRIGELPQTMGSAAASFDEVSKHAIEARQSVDKYGQLYVRVAGSTKDFLTSQEDVLQVTDSISKALVLGGASALEQKSAIEQLSQGFQAGKFQGNDFKIAMAALSTEIREKLATAMGYTLANLKEMSSKGMITAEMMAKAFIKIGPDVANSFKRVPLTIGQAFTIIQGKFAIFINRMNRESFAITKIASFFVDTFEGLERGLNSLIDNLEGGGQALKIFGIALAAALAPAAIRIFLGALATLFSPMALLIVTAFAAGLALEDLYTWFKGGDSVIGRWIGNFRDADGSVKVLNASVAALIATFGLFLVAAPLGTLRVLIVLLNAMSAALFINLVRLESEIVLYSRLAAIWVAQTIPAIWAQATAWLAASAAALGVTLPLWAIIGIIALVAGAVYVLYKVFTGQFGDIKKFVSDTWDGILSGFKSMVDGLMSYWQKFKSFWGIGASTTLSVNGSPNQPNVVAPSSTASTAAGNAQTNNVTINQTLPPGTPAETAQRANDGAKSAIDDFFGLNKVARQMGQVQ